MIYELECLIGGNFITPQGVHTSSHGNPSNVFDGNTGNYMYVRTYGTWWIQVELDTPEAIESFRWYTQSYNPRYFKVLGSNDGTTWDTLLDTEGADTAGWKESTWVIPLQLPATLAIKGLQKKHLLAPALPKDYSVDTLELHPDFPDKKHLRLTTLEDSRFNNNEGHLTIEYTQIPTGLAGRGGLVESFSQTFTPTDLVPVPNPYAAEHVTFSMTPSMVATQVYYNRSTTEEHVSVSLNDITLLVTKVGTNPL